MVCAREPAYWGSRIRPGRWSFAEQFPCQIRYVRTSDGKVACLGDAAGFRERYLSEIAPLILEGAVFGDRWDVTWAKFTDIPAAQRLDAIKTAAVVADLLVHMTPGLDLWSPGNALPRSQRANRGSKTRKPIHSRQR